MNRPLRYQLLALLFAVSAAPIAHGQDSTSTTAAYGPPGPEFRVMGFGDFSYISKDGSNADGFTVGQVVAHLSASLGDSFGVFGEFSSTARDSGYATGVERLIVKYDYSDQFKLSAGRYHTPIGYWNSGFHHGAWLQTTVSRPEMIKFGSKIVPIHFVGILLEGLIPSGALGLSYKVGVGNGRHSNIAAAGDTGDINSDKAWMVQLNSKSRKFYGLNVGLGFYNDEIPLADGTDVLENTFSAHAVWAKESPEIVFEYLHSTHELLTDSSISGDVDAWYAQIAYRLPGRHSQWKPYARFEQNRVDDSDPLLGAEALNFDSGVVGVRWDFNPYATLKAEYRNEKFDDGIRENNFRLQISFVLAKM